MSGSGLGRLRAVCASNAGLLLVVASEAFYASMNVSVKVLTTGRANISILEILFLRMIATYVFSVAYMYYAKVEHPILGPPEVRHLLLSRGASGFFGVWGLYYSLQYLSLSDAVVLTFLKPLCTAIAGSVILKEGFTKREALAGILSLLGVVLIARPPLIFGTTVNDDNENLRTVLGLGDGVTTGQRMVAVGVALTGVLGAMVAFISIRAAGKRAHPHHHMVYFSMVCVTASTVGMTTTHTPVVVPSEWPSLSMIFLICVFGFISQTLMTKGFQIQAAGRASMGTYTQLIFALILERIVFGTVPEYLSMLGSVLILGSALYVAVMKEERRDGDGAGGKIALPDENDEGHIEEGLLGPHEGDDRNT